MSQLRESGLVAALRLANQGTILDITYALHCHSPRHLRFPVADLRLSALRDRLRCLRGTPHRNKLPGTRFIPPALKKSVSGEIGWNKTAAHKFCTVRREERLQKLEI